MGELVPEEVVLELRPDLGVPPLLFGMTTAEASVAMSGWGELRLPSYLEWLTMSGRLQNWLRLNVHDNSCDLDVYANFENGERLASVMIWRPQAGPGSPRRVVVVYDGIDVFGQPAADVMLDLRARGLQPGDDPFFPRYESVALGFNRDLGDERDYFNGYDVALYFANVLVAPPGYDNW